MGACSNGTRATFGGGYISGSSDTIDFVTISTTGNASDFGNLSLARSDLASCSSAAGRGVFGGGSITDSPYVTDVIDYIDISTTGNASDFGNLVAAATTVAASSDGSRGVFGGGADANNSGANTIQYIAIATTGNTTDFGDLTAARDSAGSCSGT